MYFTPDGLEQATRLPVAAHRAARLAAAAPRRVVDLGCGIGGDLVALRPGRAHRGRRRPRPGAGRGRRGQPRRPRAAPAPSRSPTRPTVDIVAASTWPSPTRPGARPRAGPSTSTTGPRRGPSSSRCCAGDACVKVAPGIPHDLVPAGVEAEWVSDHGEVKEAALWSRPAGHGRAPRDRDRRRRAGHPDRRGRPRRADVGPARRASSTSRTVPSSGPAWSPRSRPGSRAGCSTAHIAYVTADESFRTPFARAYEVLEDAAATARSSSAPRCASAASAG